MNIRFFNTFLLLIFFTFSFSQTTCSEGLTVEGNITSNYNGSAISCNSSCDGEITINAYDLDAGPLGSGPYEYEFSGPGVPSTGFGSQTVYSNLCAGIYNITVRDLSQEIVPGTGIYEQCTTNVNLQEPQSISFTVLTTIEPSCNTICDGQAFTVVSGGTGNLTINWSSGETGTNPSQLCTGVNSLIITDDNGCTLNTETVTINPTIDISTTLSGDTITANQSGLMYKWLDCNNGNMPIPGETNQSFTATTTGSYAVELTDMNSCTVTSNCVDINSLSIEGLRKNNFVVYQNINSNTIHVEAKKNLKYSINIYSIAGNKMTKEIFYNQSIIKLPMNYKSGLYIIEFKIDNKREYHKVILR